MAYLFTSESVSEGHPDKVADQISDAVLDEFLKQDPESKVACETFVSTGLVVVGGEAHADAYVDIQHTAREIINRIGYTKAEYMFDGNSCGILSALHGQSADIRRGVEKKDKYNQGAGDQGIMFGYACRETDDYMPLPIWLSHRLLQELAEVRKNTKLMPYLRPDAKSQFTIEYSDDRKPLKVHTIVLSTQHDEFAQDAEMLKKIKDDVQNILIPRLIKKLPARLKGLFDCNYKLLVNPTGKFVIGGPHGDTGLTGRKIIVDTYGGRGAHGGGALSGKDASKVDRSAAYAARYIAKNLVAAGVADEVQIQISYAIGVAKPLSIFINTFRTARVAKNGGPSASGKAVMSDGEIAKIVGEIFDLRPAVIIDKFQLKNPIYLPTAAYGHMGRTPYVGEVTVVRNGKNVKKRVQFFGWELLDAVPKVKKAFGI
ncbi:MAG TPA: methionine adenosyltransferase [Candidatus Egerieousia sp.]|nr:methionine adenosyltransferase [Candidatus Egerieousia sp.]HPT05168.1 methionine adenosyltransferase [Candidatus Egerieousia sp.]